MPAYLTMPKLSDTMSEGTLVKWLKSEGDSVGVDEEVAEVETDKATMAMPCFDEGILHKIYVKEGETVALGATLALILEEGEEPPADADTPPAPPASEESDSADEEKKEEAPPASEAPKEAAPQPAAVTSGGGSPAPTNSSGGRVKASPLARKMAEEQGIDLARVRGSGPGGRIVREDLEYAATGGGGSNLGLLPVEGGLKDEVTPLSGMRRVIAQRLLESKTTIPHFYLNIEVDTEPLMDLRAQVNEASLANDGPKYTVNDFIMRATVLATEAVPEVNASFTGDAIQQFGEVHLSIAVAIDEGLVTPVIRSAQTKSIKELAAEIKDLAGRARDKKLAPDEMQGGTITISNLGAYGIGHFDAIINPPQAAILSIGTITKQPVVNSDNQIVPGQRMWIGMSCDHRVVDGAIGATFLGHLKKYIESPFLLIS
ncbi:2-oxo acid dehydrogenase subunit E2 [Verrucomicrobiales bacterium]|nr:2-oxo acid dehydrogenase subunit E2 [Verrucomicrobiales bacterium]MDB2496905.1 2-oxo acid dehydrogenase subunit E2 [Verrucomicrobiales bacterium]